MGDRLNRVREGKIEYYRLLRRVDELKALAEKVTPTISDMPKGGNHTTEDTWVELADYKSRCEFQLKTYIADCASLEEELDCIRNPDIRTAMKYRYIDCLQVDEIMDLMHYERRWTYKLLSRGRRIYAKYYP